MLMKGEKLITFYKRLFISEPSSPFYPFKLFFHCIKLYTHFAFLTVKNKSLKKRRGSNTLRAMLERKTT